MEVEGGLVGMEVAVMTKVLRMVARVAAARVAVARVAAESNNSQRKLFYRKNHSPA